MSIDNFPCCDYNIYMDNKKIDLHTHTIYSDGSMSPAELIAKAKKDAVDTLSITDHDTVEAYKNLPTQLSSCKILIVPGIEFSCVEDDVAIHLLGYGIDVKNGGVNQIAQHIRDIQLTKATVFKNILYDYKLASVADVIDDKITKNFGLRNYSFYNALKDSGVDPATSLKIKQKYKNCIAFLDSIETYTDEVISVIKSAGGLSILAHPGEYNLNNIKTFELLDKLVKKDLNGVEIFHSANSSELQVMLDAFCKDNHLLVTGGSDYHSGETTLGALDNPVINTKISKEILDKSEYEL